MEDLISSLKVTTQNSIKNCSIGWTSPTRLDFSDEQIMTSPLSFYFGDIISVFPS